MSRNLYLKNPYQQSSIACPWSLKEAILIRIWEVVWTLFVRWLPKICSRWHIVLLKLFGGKIHGHSFISHTVRIYAPWLLEIGTGSSLGTRCEIYNLGPVIIGERVTIAQYSYICNGTHDLSTRILPLMVGKVNIGNDVFIGAKAIILPGLRLGVASVIGAGSVLTKDTDDYGIYAGNPARYIKKRVLK